MHALRHHLLSIDAQTGHVDWDQAEKADLPDANIGVSSPCMDLPRQRPFATGRRSTRFSAAPGSGRTIWPATASGRPASAARDTGRVATSLLLYENLVIVNASVESRAIVALDKATGHEQWRHDGVRKSWSTPALVKLPGGSELVYSMEGKAMALEPATGKERWHCTTVPDYVCPSVVGRTESCTSPADASR